MLVAYPQPGKAKSLAICGAFAKGCGGRVNCSSPILEPGAAACFFGVVGIEHLLRLAIAEQREYWYGDNAFFDRGRGRYFRFARNCLQLHTIAEPAHGRLKALGVTVSPWKRDGGHIVVVEQSAHFMSLVGHNLWLLDVVSRLRHLTDRPLRIRRWSRDKAKAAAGLRDDLRGAWALVTHMSAAANEALLAGVPVFVSGMCAALPMASGDFSNIETPRYPDGREDWAAGLAGQQWTMDELRNGTAWRTLSGIGEIWG